MKLTMKINLCLGALLTIAIACNKDFGAGEEINYKDTVKEKIDTDPQFSFFKRLYVYHDSVTNATRPTVVTANQRIPLLSGTLGSKFITAFVPTNAAFLKNGITYISRGDSLNPLLIRFMTRNDAVKNPVDLSIVAAFLSNFLNNSMVDNAVFTQNFRLKTIGGTVNDSLHVFSSNGGYSLYGNAQVDVAASKKTSNGYIYPIDNLITPVYNGQFNALSTVDTSLVLFNQALIKAADPIITAAIAGNIQNTIFAPTNQAFIKAGLTAAVIASPATTQATLRKLLEHHIANRQRLYTPLLTNGPLAMLDGTTVTVSTTPTITIKSANTALPAKILVPNIHAVRSVVHKIDQVLRP